MLLLLFITCYIHVIMNNFMSMKLKNTLTPFLLFICIINRKEQLKIKICKTQRKL